jgi:hypothetical protein
MINRCSSPEKGNGSPSITLQYVIGSIDALSKSGTNVGRVSIEVLDETRQKMLRTKTFVADNGLGRHFKTFTIGISRVDRIVYNGRRTRSNETLKNLKNLDRLIFHECCMDRCRLLGQGLGRKPQLAIIIIIIIIMIIIIIVRQFHFDARSLDARATPCEMYKTRGMSRDKGNELIQLVHVGGTRKDDESTRLQFERTSLHAASFWSGDRAFNNATSRRALLALLLEDEVVVATTGTFLRLLLTG